MDADFKSGNVSADGGVLLLREIDLRSGVIDGLAACFTDYRRQHLIAHTVPESNPLRPRAFGGKGAEGMKKEIPSN